MRSRRIGLIVLMLIGVAVSAQAATPWVLPEWKYRAPVQIINAGSTAVEVAALAIADVPSTLLISEGKLARSGADLRLVDEKGNSLPLRTEQLLSDTGDARLVFVWTMSRRASAFGGCIMAVRRPRGSDARFHEITGRERRYRKQGAEERPAVAGRMSY
jgi:hypothetical protein